jgi:hypothetical protein
MFGRQDLCHLGCGNHATGYSLQYGHSCGEPTGIPDLAKILLKTYILLRKGYERHLRFSSETYTFYQNDVAMRNTADVKGGKSIAV